jgi:acid phosphatase family membrane protein YuiD
MSFLNQVFLNKVLINGLIAWAIAQIIKAGIYTAINKKFEVRRLIGDGGMPSGHSATVSAAAVTSAFSYGFSSFEFAISAIFAIVVMHDAMGVRLEAGKQAKLLNKMTSAMNDMNMQVYFEEKLKEFVGHTPTQVLAGCGIGVLVAIIFT